MAHPQDTGLARAPLAPRNPDPRLHVFKVEDGGTHWVAEAHPGKVSQVMADSHQISRAEYAREYEPKICRMEPHETVEIIQDCAQVVPDTLDLNLPENTFLRVVAVTTVRDWIQLGFRGIIATTEV